MLALLDLPDELLLHVALQCDDIADVLRFARTCTALHALITHTDHFWEQLLHAHYGSAHVCDAHASPCDHRSLYREQCERLTWAWPTSSRGYLSHIDGDASRLQMIKQAAAGAGFVMRSAFTAQSLPSTGLSAVCVRIPEVALEIGLLVYDRDLDGEWDQHRAPDAVPRVRICTFSGSAIFAHLYPATLVYGEAAYQPAGWRAGSPPSCDAASGKRAYVAVDADRGRVYLALGTPECWLVAFDEARLARLGNLRVCVTLWDKTFARIERVRVTDEMRAALRALDAEYEAVRRARAKE